MIRKKELLERIEQLEKELKETKEAFDFEITYGKDKFKFWSSSERRGYGWWYPITERDFYVNVSYLKGSKLFETKIETPYYVENDSIGLLEKIDDDNFVIKCKAYVNKVLTDKYFQLTKSTGQIIDITEIKAKYENQEKVSEKLKQSAETLGDALSSIFSAPKQKTQKKAKPSEKTKAKCECEKKSCKKGKV